MDRTGSGCYRAQNVTIDRELVAAGLAGAFGALALALIVGRRLGRWWRTRKARRRARRARRGEARAEGLLERLGYTIDDRQAETTWTLRVDGDDHEVELRADLLVTRDGARYVAEVKTGRLAPRITSASTRRQLLEYRMAYDVAGVLLVDAEAGRVVPVEFPLPKERAGRGPGALGLVAWLAAFCAGASAGLLVDPWLAQWLG